MKKLLALFGAVAITFASGSTALALHREGSDSSGQYSYVLDCVTGGGVSEPMFQNVSGGGRGILVQSFDGTTRLDLANTGPNNFMGRYDWEGGWRVVFRDPGSGDLVTIDADPNMRPSDVCETSPAVPPSAPLAVRSTPGNGRVVLAWTPPSSDGGSPLTDYVVQQSVNGTTWTTFNEGVSTTPNAAVTGLANGTSYRFRVLAVNAVGTGPASAVVNATPRTVPTAPRNLTARPGNGSVTLTWLLPASNAGAAITDYVIQRRVGTGAWVTVNDGVGTQLTRTVTGLVNGTTYRFQVLAKNSAGNSPASSIVSGVPRTVPSAARSLTVTPGNGSAVLRWSAPASTGGATVTDYVIQRYVSGSSWVTISDGVRATTGYTATGLRNGTRYYFRVFARNAAGTGTVSNTVNTIPRTVPTAPRLRAYPGSTRALLAWTPPTSNGGAAITRYVIQRSTNPTSGWVYISTSTPVSARSFMATGLRNGTRYYFRIAAVNVAGTGAWGPAVSVVPSALAGSGYYFPNCTAVHQAGAAPLLRAQPGYRLALDRDRDGVACE